MITNGISRLPFIAGAIILVLSHVAVSVEDRTVVDENYVCLIFQWIARSYTTQQVGLGI